MPSGVYVRTEKHRGKHWKWSDESRLKFSLSKKGCVSPNKGKKFSKEYRKKLSIAHLGQISWNKGKKMSLETCMRISKAQKGKKLSEETKRKISESHRGDKCYLWKGGISKNKKEYRKEYYKKNKFKRITHVQNRRELVKIRGGLSLATIQRVYEDNIKKYGTLTCVYCLEPIKFGKDTLEHKIPLTKGGNNLYENLGIACIYCNSSKGNRYTAQEFMEKKCSGKKLPSM